MAKRDNGFLLTPGDKNKLAIIKDLLDQAMKEKKRAGQVIALMDAQKELMGVVTWFLMRDIL